MAGVGVIDYLTSEEDKLVIEDGDVNTVYRFLLGPAEEEEIVEAENKHNLKIFKLIKDEVKVVSLDVGEESNGVPQKRRKRQKGCGRLSVTTADYRCRFCNKAFTQAINLASHERIHTGERPFVCKICLKRFTQQPNLWKHIRVHTGERPYRCSMCRKSFTQQANLDKHFMTHTGERPYNCSICGKCFSQQANLTKHVRLHTGERPYACPYCPKTFVQRSNLQRHCRVHTGERPFTCKLCPKAYAQYANLATHGAVHHRAVPFADVIERRSEGEFIMMGVTPLKSEHSKSTESEMSKRRGIPVLFCTKTNTIIKRLE